MSTTTQPAGSVHPPRPPVLAPADHEHFLKHGFVVVKSVVPPDIIATAVAALEEQHRQTSIGDGYTRTPTPEATSACSTERMHDAIAELFGQGYTHTRRPGGGNMPRKHQPGAAWPTPTAHVDDDYPTIMPNGWAVGSFLFLTRVQAHGGAYIYFAGSPNRFRQAMYRSPNLIKGMTPDVRHSGPYAEFLAEPGDLLLFHHLLGHSGSNNVADPQTRHALLGRWHPQQRIVPGAKPFDQMTTIEKANSPRYLREVLGYDVAGPAFPHGAEAIKVLRHGWCEGQGLVTQVMVHFDGQTHLLHVDAAAPTVIRDAVSTDLVHWKRAGVIEPSIGNIASVNLWQRMGETHLTVGGERDGAYVTCVLASNDMQSWRPIARYEGFRGGQAFFNGKGYASQIAWGNVLYLTSADEPSRLLCRWHGQDAPQPATLDWSQAVEVLQAPVGKVIRDAAPYPKLGEQHYSFLFDVADTAKPKPTTPHYVLTRETAKLETPLVPLPHSCPTAPHSIRPYMRARNYWLVSYLRRHEDRDRLFFGTIDWQADPVELIEITTPAAMHEALCTVGFA